MKVDSIDYNNELNPEQLAVVREAEGSCLVLAGAGSGKTRTLVYRIAYLLEQGILPEHILLMTFTNKAAREMVGRIRALLGAGAEGLWSGTFHSIGHRILRTHAHLLGYPASFVIMDASDAQSLLKEAYKELHLDQHKAILPKLPVLQDMMSYSRNTGIRLENLFTDRYAYLNEEALPHVMALAEKYGDKKRAGGLMDFDDLLANWLKLLKEHEQTATQLRRQFNYILIDEYQDTNALQASLVYELSGGKNNVLAVGDDAQSIYSFRGADIQNILDFPKQYAHTRTFRIETNYRSTPEILQLAQESINHNRAQFEKKLIADKPHGTQKPVVVHVRDAREQAAMIADELEKLKSQGITADHIAVLFRSTYHSADLQMELTKRDVPHIVRGGVRYFEQAHIKDILAYLRALHHTSDEVSWKRVLLLYTGIGPAAAQKLWTRVQAFERYASIPVDELLVSMPPATRSSLTAFFNHLARLSEYIGSGDAQQPRIGEAIQCVSDSYYNEYAKTAFENYRDRLEDIAYLASVASGYTNLAEFLSDVSLSEQFQEDGEKPNHQLVLSTIHQAKGLEWDVVFIIGLRESWFPHQKSFQDRASLEEERRLFYVAATRARKKLYLLYPMLHRGYGGGESAAEASLFLRELDTSLHERNAEDARQEALYTDDDTLDSDDDRPTTFLNFYLKRKEEEK